MATTAAAIGQIKATTPRGNFLDRYFYFGMSLLIAAVVVYGFSHTVNENLFHPAVPRPFLLYIHGAVFTGWLVFFILQSALVRTRNVQIHRKLGWFGAGLGAAVSIVGVSTAIMMTGFHIHQLHEKSDGALAFLTVSFNDIFCFTIAFALAIYWRKKPEFHRRLMLIASCALTAAAFGRFPVRDSILIWFYVGVDFLILLGAIRDLIVNRRVHQVYLYALPLLAVFQISAIFIFLHKTPFWMKIAQAVAG